MIRLVYRSLMATRTDSTPGAMWQRFDEASSPWEADLLIECPIDGRHAAARVLQWIREAWELRYPGLLVVDGPAWTLDLSLLAASVEELGSDNSWVTGAAVVEPSVDQEDVSWPQEKTETVLRLAIRREDLQAAPSRAATVAAADDLATATHVRSPELDPSLAGTVLDDRYEVVGSLGEGGMGSVWRAHDRRLRVPVAIKKLLEDERKRIPESSLWREIEALKRLHHAGIPTLRDQFEDGGTSYMVTDLIEGETLAARIRGEALEPPEARRVFRALADILQHAHDHGVVHRDLSSRNIMLRPDGFAAVIDFGISRILPMEQGTATAAVAATALELSTLTGQIAGSPPYMSPEQVSAGAVDPASDQWSLGVLLFESLSGRRPFDRGSAQLTMRAILSEPPSWALLPSHVSPDLRTTIERMLCKDPADRFASMATVAPLLEGDVAAIQLPSSAQTANSPYSIRIEAQTEPQFKAPTFYIETKRDGTPVQSLFSLCLCVRNSSELGISVGGWRLEVPSLAWQMTGISKPKQAVHIAPGSITIMPRLGERLDEAFKLRLEPRHEEGNVLVWFAYPDLVPDDVRELQVVLSAEFVGIGWISCQGTLRTYRS